MGEDRFELRVARHSDAEGVTAVLASAYPALMAGDYDAAVLAVVLPSMTVANAALLESGQYYVRQTLEGRIVSCGGWTREEPGTARVETGVAHLRHFGTHLDWTRRGLARSIFDRCKRDAVAAGVRILRCFSSLNAEPFYASVGLHAIERKELVIKGGLRLPTVTMTWTVPNA